MSTSQLPVWPQSALSPNHLNHLQNSAATYAFANSILLKQASSTGVQASHLPFTLLPSPFPRDQFEKATRIQTAYNQLYINIASSPELIREVLGKSIAKVDPFVGRLYEIWETLEKEEAEEEVSEHVSLGIFRNDFLLHQEEPNKPLVIKQVEFNTVSVSFGSLASKVSALHRYLGGLTTVFNRSQLPDSPNQALQSICKALRMAHQHYVSAQSPNKPAAILMIVKPNENNIFDQSLIEFELDSEPHSIRVIRLSCNEILTFTTVDPVTKKLFYKDAEMVKWEVSVVYYRSMYGPEDFKGDDEWKGRYELERSRAINCPSLSMQLAGCKKLQQIMTEREFLATHQALLMAHIEPSEWEELRSTWTSMYSLDDPRGLQIANDPNQAVDFVLKPQREGGGNNFYGLQIPPFVAGLPASERESYILMSLIKTPKNVFNYMVRPSPIRPTHESHLTDDAQHLNVPVPTEIISELGVYGFCLLSRKRTNPSPLPPGGPGKSTVNTLLFNFQSGHLLRTKDSGSGEGGVAIGISCLDSPLLV
ncbi:glutathione synthetase [Puccinia sorghi]|uniref:Glutathione synthetase n=1 Tax=Puccinia sorghi TaxID=27349 RepID=A0A0L6VK79_9BASI|nr:glutathione synthetase [Puccinia sorghi]